MAYQILRNVPRIAQGDELVYFTQSVIKMEKQLFQIAEGQQTNASVTYTRTSPESISTPDDCQIGFDGIIFTPSELRISGKGTESVRCKANSREGRLGFTSREPIYGSAELTQSMPQHTLMPRRHMTESRDSIIWSPSQTSPQGEDCKLSGCNITLSRVYFADASKKSYKLHASEYNYPGNDAEEFGNFNLPPTNNTTDRQKKWFKDKTMTTSARRQSAPSSSCSPLAKPSSILGGMFPTPQSSGGRKQAHKRSLSETGEYVYFLSESRKPKSFSRDAFCPRSRAACNEYFPPEKRSKNEQKEPETIVIPDDNDVKQRANNVATVMQVITDSEGRIRVNVVESPTKDKHVEATKALEDYHGYLEGNPRELSDSKDFLETNECSIKAINFENQIPETSNATSALITNDDRWNAWKKANCIPIDDFDSANYNMGNCDSRKGQFCEGHLERYVVDENNNICSVVDTPHLKKIIQTPNHCIPDNVEVVSHAELAKQNFIKPQTTHLERCTRVLDFPKDNCPENYQPMLMNGQRWVCMDTHNTHCQKTRVLDGPDIHASAHHSRVSNRQTSGQHSYESTTQRESLRTPKGDAGCNFSKCEIKSRQGTTIMKVSRKDPKFMRKNKVQPSCSTPKNKGTKDNSSETLPTQAKKGKESSDSVERKAESKSTAEDNNVSKETQNTSPEIEAKSRYQCDWPACDKSFRHYSFLVLHKRIHTGERPYVCSWQGCSKQFRRSDDYQRHYRVHTGVKPYVCLLCGKKFKRSDHRLFHYRAIHHVENLGKAKKRKVQRNCANSTCT